MIRLCIPAVLVACSSFAPLASAEPEHADGHEPLRSGPTLGISAGYRVPNGQAFAGSGPLGEVISAGVPFRFDVAYRATPHLFLGIMGELGVVVQNGCSRCSGSQARFGVRIGWRFLPTASLDPWIAVGAGWESLSLRQMAGRRTVDISMRGFELVALEVGVDLRPTQALRVGPFVSGSLGRFETITMNGVPSDDFATTIHDWITVGLRGAWDL